MFGIAVLGMSGLMCIGCGGDFGPNPAAANAATSSVADGLAHAHSHNIQLPYGVKAGTRGAATYIYWYKAHDDILLCNPTARPNAMALVVADMQGLPAANVDERAVEAVHFVSNSFNKLTELFSINHDLAAGFQSKSLGIAEGMQTGNDATEVIHNATSKVAETRALLEARYGNEYPQMGPLGPCVVMSTPKRELW